MKLGRNSEQHEQESYFGQTVNITSCVQRLTDSRSNRGDGKAIENAQALALLSTAHLKPALRARCCATRGRVLGLRYPVSDVGEAGLSRCGFVRAPRYGLARLGDVLARSRRGMASAQKRRDAQEC